MTRDDTPVGDAAPRGQAILALIAGSKPVEVFLTLVVYTIYAGVLALSVFPTMVLLIRLLPPIVAPAIGAPFAVLLRTGLIGALVLALGFYCYLFSASVVQALFIRLVSLGIKPGRYPAISVTTLRWLIFSGVFTISMRTHLPVIPVSFLINLYFRIIGCKMGRNVKINSPKINDAYLLTLEDDVIIGGGTDITCHLFERDHLILQRIRIGAGTLIGSNSYIAPGVSIGKRCIVGVSSYLRSGREIPDNSVVTSVGGVDVRIARAVERGRFGAEKTSEEKSDTSA
jgi:acetyltransferase-like isoleucine patch superfamily enzyme